jgi:virulence-associated protein VapD
VAETAARHPKGVAQAYAEIGATLADRGFERVQGSVTLSPNADLARRFTALNDPTSHPSSVRNLRAFRIDQWPDVAPTKRGCPPTPSWTLPPIRARIIFPAH